MNSLFYGVYSHKVVAIFVNTGGFSAPAQKILEKAGIEITTGSQWNL